MGVDLKFVGLYYSHFVFKLLKFPSLHPHSNSPGPAQCINSEVPVTDPSTSNQHLTPNPVNLQRHSCNFNIISPSSLQANSDISKQHPVENGLASRVLRQSTAIWISTISASSTTTTISSSV